MGKTLDNLIKGGGKIGAVLGLVGSLMGCPDLNTPSNPPTAKLSTEYSTGKSPLTTRLSLECDDLDNDVTQSYIFVDYNNNGTKEEGEELTTSNTNLIDYNHTFNEAGEFNVYGGCVDSKGNTAVSEPVRITVKDYVDISGRLEDCETDTGRKGKIRVYDTRVNTAEEELSPEYDYSDLLGEFNTDNDGNFNFTLNKEVNIIEDDPWTKEDERDLIYVRTVMGDFDNPTSYIRTKALPARDLILNQNFSSTNPATSIKDLYENGVMRVVPFDNPEDNYDDDLQDVDGNNLQSEEGRENFKEHMGRTNFWGVFDRIGNNYYDNGWKTMRGNEKHGLKKFNSGELPDLKSLNGTSIHPIFKGYDMETQIEGYGLFDDSEKEKIKSAIQLSNYPQDGINSLKFERKTQPEPGWISISKQERGYGPWAIIYGGSNGYLKGVTCYLNWTETPGAVLHEVIYHGRSASGGHADTANVSPLFYSIGAYAGETPDGVIEYPVDRKSYNLIDEPTFIGMEPLDDILGM